jgi:RNA polymerase-interacting CarD/CdnL/TRCF family regulator
MSEAKYGRDFIKHELDEAISIQNVMVETARTLADAHPEPAARRLIKGMVRDDERQLRELEQLGTQYGASGKVEDVAEVLRDLARATTESASEAESEAYEAHAVLLALKRKQQDSAGAVLKIARAIRDTEMRDAARTMLRETKAAAQALADSLADFAVVIATREPARASSKG